MKILSQHTAHIITVDIKEGDTVEIVNHGEKKMLVNLSEGYVHAEIATPMGNVWEIEMNKDGKLILQ